MMTELRITVLAENTASGQGMLAEHGLAFWLEMADQTTVLFDTGQGCVLAGNAAKLGIALENADAVVLSHGHYDHSGGLGAVLGMRRGIPVFAHPAALAAKYSRSHDGTVRAIGMSATTRRVLADQALFMPVEKPTTVGDRLHLTGPIPRASDFENTGGAFFIDPEGTEPDLLPDDQAVFIDTSGGTVVILGCAHAGVINTLKYIRKLTKQRSIHTVIGGMHLLNASPERMARTVTALRRLDVPHLFPCHCTGFAGMARLWNAFPGRCAACPVGTVIAVPTESCLS